MKRKSISFILVIAIVFGLWFVGKQLFFPALAKDKQAAANQQQALEQENDQVKNEEETQSNDDKDSDQEKEANSGDKDSSNNNQNNNNQNDKPDQQQTLNLDNTLSSWYFQRNADHKTPQTNAKYLQYLKGYGFYVGDSSKKVVYLTFDNGYENGYTAKILDILRANNTKAAFFVTGSYVKQNPELVNRMVKEGHVVGNHTQTHPSLPKISDSKIREEIKTVEEQVQELTGVKMTYLRPPAGEFSQRTLFATKEIGYKTIFWSIAYKDWLVDEQPGKEYAHKHVMDNVHNGAIILLHAVSQSNTEALDSIIKDLKAQGYRFATLDELN